MQTNRPGRHRKPSATRAIALRTAGATGAAVAAVLVSAGGASAATTAAAPSAEAPPLAISCTGYPIDAFTTCATAGHYGKGGNAGDFAGGDTPVPGGPPA